MTMEHPAIAVIIVSYNTADLLPACIESVLAQETVASQIMVIDNASADETVDILRHRCYRDLELIANRENLGFARACNQGLRRCRAGLVLFLNPDTVVQPGCFPAILDYMARHPQVGLAGTMILDPDMRPHPSVEHAYPGHHYVRDELDGLPGDIAWLLGASLVGRTALLRAIGGFAEEFFLYGEDIDLGLRMRKAGHPLGFIPRARVVHLEGQSERSAPVAAVFARKIRAELLFCRRHYRRETVRRIARARWLQAVWRIAGLRLSLAVTRDREAVREKLMKYQVTRRLYGHYLRRGSEN